MSKAVHVTRVVAAPANWLPEAGTQLWFLIPDKSVAGRIENETVAFGCPTLGTVTMFAGQEILGGVMSVTVMVNEQLTLS